MAKGTDSGNHPGRQVGRLSFDLGTGTLYQGDRAVASAGNGRATAPRLSPAERNAQAKARYNPIERGYTNLVSGVTHTKDSLGYQTATQQPFVDSWGKQTPQGRHAAFFIDHSSQEGYHNLG